MTLHTRLDLGSTMAMFPLTPLRDAAREKARASAATEKLVPKEGSSPAALFGGAPREMVPPDEESIAKHAARMSPGGELITSPHDIAVVEQLRREALGSEPPGAMAVDVFVFGEGEPAAPYLTKIGGIPFRSRNKPWPTTADGRPRAFLGQLSFVDSRDLFPELPGDVLLIFAKAPDLYTNDPDAYVFEWVSLDEGDLIAAEAIPEVTYVAHSFLAKKEGKPPETKTFAPFVCHGVVHRTYDLPSEHPALAVYKKAYLLSALEAVKIGGVPRFIQVGAVPTGKRFLGSVASVQPASGAYPWVNRAEPYEGMAARRLSTLMFGDMGSLYLFIDDQGQVSGLVQSY